MSEFKRAGRITMEERPPKARNKWPIRHGPTAAALFLFGGAMFLSSLVLAWRGMSTWIEEGVPGEVTTSLALGSLVFWTWGSVHLTRHLKINPIWSLCGLIPLVGPFFILAAGNKVPEWKAQNIASQDLQHRQEQEGKGGDPY